MIESFDQFWPVDVPLWLYAQDFSPLPPHDAPVSSRVMWRDLHESCPELVAFKARHKNNPVTNGRKNGKYTYRFDAVKFANKTLAVIDAVTVLALMMDTDRVIWIDADTVTHSWVPREFVDSLCPDTAAIAWLAREKAYPECGFYVVNTRHPATADLMAHWQALYTKDKIFRVPETHDSFVLEWLVKAYGVPTVSISGEGAKTNHPFVNGPCGAFMDHLKSDRFKKLGHTPGYHLKTRREEPYWRKIKDFRA